MTNIATVIFIYLIQKSFPSKFHCQQWRRKFTRIEICVMDEPPERHESFAALILCIGKWNCETMKSNRLIYFRIGCDLNRMNNWMNWFWFTVQLWHFIDYYDLLLHISSNISSWIPFTLLRKNWINDLGWIRILKMQLFLFSHFDFTTIKVDAGVETKPSIW